MAVGAVVLGAAAGAWDVFVDFAAHGVWDASCAVASASWAVLVGEEREGLVYVSSAECAGVFFGEYAGSEFAASVTVGVSR